MFIKVLERQAFTAQPTAYGNGAVAQAGDAGKRCRQECGGTQRPDNCVHPAKNAPA